MIRATIFDLGGTLAAPGERLSDEELDRRNAGALLSWLRQNGLRVEDTFVEALVAERRASVARRARDAAEVTVVEALRPALQQHQLPHHAAFVVECEVAFFQPELSSMRLLPGAEEILRRARAAGLHLGLASNASSHYFVTECCRRLGLDVWLDPIVTSAGIGWQKPDRRIFNALLSAWSLAPGEVVMVGDSPSADIAGANGLGMRSILIAGNRPPEAPAPRPDAIAQDLTQAGDLLEQWILAGESRG